MQENGKQVTVKMTARRAYRTEPIWQYDVGHELVFVGFDGLPETFQVHFARNMFDEAVTMIGQDGVCAVPDMYAQTASPIYAWLYIAEDDTGLTKYSIEIPVERRAQITDQEPTPVEQSAIDQAIAALNDGVTRAEAAQAAAEGAQAGAEGYAETAADSAITATDAARAASASETAAVGSASAAASSATDARASREGADQSATAAGVSERAAKASETAAAGSASAAAGSASAAAGSASQAAGYASTATDNARAAAGSATAADTSARAAAGFAADSQQSAQAAAAIAQGAAASAAAADGSATEAAGSASAAAGSASAAAGSATAAAGSAQQAAQTVAGIDAAGAAQVAAIEAKGAEVIAEIPADYSELSGDVNSIKSAINELEPVVDDLKINKADIIVSSASGAIASFSDGADGMPVKSLSVAIEPVQDLHGYDSPWPGGGGKNKLDPVSLKTIIADISGASGGTDADGRYVVIPQNGYINNVVLFADFVENQQYTLIFKVQPTGHANTNIRVYYTDDSAENITASGDGQLSTVTYTTTSGKTVASVKLGYWYSVSTKVYYDDCGIFVGANQTFAPYSNICPISGWDEVKVTRAGINLFDKTAITADKKLNATGGLSNSTWTCVSNYIPVKAGQEYYIGHVIGSNSGYSIAYYDESKQFIKTYSRGGIADTSFADTVPDNAAYMKCTVANENIDIACINYPATDTEYHDYRSAQTVTIQLGQTVYGGSLTVNEDGTGSLKVDRAEADLGTLTWSVTGDRFSVGTRLVPNPVKRTTWGADDPIAICSQYKYGNIGNWNGVDKAVGFYNGMLYARDTSYATVSDFKTAMSGVQLVYELAEPIEYTLTASQVQTLLGVNNVWADSGDVDVSYRADTKLYIDGKITEAIAAALNA